MSAILQFEATKAKRKAVEIEPELKAFLDSVVIPLLVRKALSEIQREKTVESGLLAVKDCARVTDCTGGAR